MTTIAVPWLSASADYLAEDLGPADRTGVRNCHMFVRLIHDLVAVHAVWRQIEPRDYLATAERLLGQAMGNPADFTASARELWGFEELQTPSDPAIQEEVRSRLAIPRVTPDLVRRVVEQRIEEGLAAARYIEQSARAFYFGKLVGCRGTGVIENSISGPQPAGVGARIDVVDLPSIDDATRMLVVNAVLQSEWEAARSAWEIALQGREDDDARVPVLIVVDEAHNLIPKDARNRAEIAIREQFRTIVAEGRKYGVFVVLVTQRPDKIDPLVLSECENRAIMKLSSAATLDLTRGMLGLEEVPEEMLCACLKSPTGRALMVGDWSGQGPCWMYAAARRTVEGGRGLRAAHWTGEPIGLA